MKTQRSKNQFDRVLKTSTLLLVALPLTLAGCSRENESDRNVSAALTCLDTATDATSADVCVEKISGIETAQAYLIRCSANFVAQGLTGTRLANAFQQQKTPTSGGTTSTNQTLAMASYLVFSPSLTNHTAAKTVENCNKSGVPSVIGLSAMVSVATTIATISGSIGANMNPADPSTFNPAAIKANVTALLQAAQSTPDDPTVKAQVTALGQAASSAQTAYCGTGSTLSTQDVCKQLNAALAGHTDAADIGYTLLQQLNR